MRVLRAEIKYLKSVAALLTKQHSIGPRSGLSNEILYILSAKGTAKS